MEVIRDVSGKSVVYHRNYQRARARALTRLRETHTDEYKQYLREEFQRDEETGRNWVASDSDTRISIRTYSYKDTIESNQPNHNGEDASNDGGEE